METFWLSYRLEDDSSYSQRYDKLIETVDALSTKWWLEPSSFIVFASAVGIDTVAAKVKAAINPRTDIAVIGMPDFKSARLIGVSHDEDIFDLIPFIKKV